MDSPIKINEQDKQKACDRLVQMNADYMQTLIYAMSSSTLVSFITYLYNKYHLKYKNNIPRNRAYFALLSTMFAVYIGRYATGPRYFGKRLKRRRSKVSKKR